MKRNFLNLFAFYSAGILFFFGPVIAGSDGPYFPYINIAGVAIFICSAILANKFTPGSHSSATPTERI